MKITNKILIDGWNVCWKIPEIAANIPGNLHHARRTLNARIKIYFQHRQVMYKIIYDGQPGMDSHERISEKGEIEFSNDPEKADHLIIRYLKKHADIFRWTVITSDIKLARAARNLGAAIISAEDFIKKTSNRKSNIQTFKENPNLSREEIEDWLNIFKKKDDA